ncbi:hypothetical protein [uncultured Fibrella sp.]|uniref:hypothetical protein n=1 Tax=uncultured Fibrella sp. TaxID=1284596 RepID=UPI0035CA44F9
MRIIAKKDGANPSKPTLGYLKVIRFRTTGTAWQPATTQDFPNQGRVFVTAEYGQIDEQYQPNELFYADYGLNQVNYDPAIYFSCKYVTTFQQLRQPEPHELCRVIQRSFSANQNTLLIAEAVVPLTYLFLATEADIIGPFQAIFDRDLPDGRRDLRLIPASASELDQPNDYDGCVYRFRRADLNAHLLRADEDDYILDARELLESHVLREPIYFGDADELIRWAKQAIRVTEKKEFWDKLQQLLHTLPPPTGPLEHQRMTRLKDKLDRSQDWFNRLLPAFITNFLENHPQGQQALNEYLKANEGRLFHKPDLNTVPVVRPAKGLPGNILTVSDYLLQVRDRMSQMGRPLSPADVAHYVVTLHQNFLTVVAGLPGVGKTSLVTLLARASGLHQRFLPISVARGWVSARDLIGYFNPLTGAYQPATTGLFDVLQTCAADYSQQADAAYWVLLDEANLSPVEHYWSDFIRLCDPEQERTLRFNEPVGLLPIGQGLRFVATINYDHTTEPLSPRLIDRAAIIRLRPTTDELPEAVLSATDAAPVQLLTVAQLDAWFMAPLAERVLLSDEENLFSDLKRVMDDDRGDWGLPVLLSPRKRRAIINHTAALRRLLTDETTYPLQALDYAVGIHLLPLLSGRGEGFGKRLNELYDRLVRALPQSAQVLQRLIRVGQQQYHQYHFFA